MLLYQILGLIIQTIGGLFGSALLLRAWMQRARAGARNPLGAFVFALTDWIVLPLRRVIPGGLGIDWASVVGAFLIAALSVLALDLAVVMLSAGARMPTVVGVVVTALVWVLRWGLYTVMLLAIVWAVLSWVNPHAPIAPALDALLSPVLRPLRRIIPRVGGLDLSPIALFVVLQIALLIVDQIPVPL
ncbi:MAG TPA: YggT family protein [Burkholderiaceae bacterium]|nr:YggT family protein [Burkholderiaceae bacterium]